MNKNFANLIICTIVFFKTNFHFFEFKFELD